MLIQGGGKRKGAFAIYLEPWHADVFEFLDLRKKHGNEENIARDLFYDLWVIDLNMEREEAKEDWSLFCPHEAPGLADCWGKEFVKLYTKYEKEGRARKVVKAQEPSRFAILDSQVETGTPLPALQGRRQRKIEPAKFGYHQKLEPLHRDHRKLHIG